MSTKDFSSSIPQDSLLRIHYIHPMVTPPLHNSATSPASRSFTSIGYVASELLQGKTQQVVLPKSHFSSKYGVEHSRVPHIIVPVPLRFTSLHSRTPYGRRKLKSKSSSILFRGTRHSLEMCVEFHSSASAPRQQVLRCGPLANVFSTFIQQVPVSRK